jgi:ubiquinone/menaquinone biosynthesis C-methylase UbiE
MQQANFDPIAADYDSDFTNSTIGIMQRNRVWLNLKSTLKSTQLKTVLEINCGTGVDAFWLADHGFSTMATDISPEMIRIAKLKVNEKDEHSPHFEVAGFHDLEHLVKGRKFDLLFSNFAGLNCIPEEELILLNQKFANLLNPNGLMIMILLGKKSWLERLYFLLKGNFEKANRRQKPDLAKLDNHSFQMTYCYSVNETKKIFSNFFYLDSKPIGIAIPPSYLEPILKKLPFLKFVILFTESILGTFSFLSDYADHTYLVYRKK